MSKTGLKRLCQGRSQTLTLKNSTVYAVCLADECEIHGQGQSFTARWSVKFIWMRNFLVNRHVISYVFSSMNEEVVYVSLQYVMCVARL